VVEVDPAAPAGRGRAALRGRLRGRAADRRWARCWRRARGAPPGRAPRGEPGPRPQPRWRSSPTSSGWPTCPASSTRCGTRSTCWPARPSPTCRRSRRCATTRSAPTPRSGGGPTGSTCSTCARSRSPPGDGPTASPAASAWSARPTPTNASPPWRNITRPEPAAAVTVELAVVGAHLRGLPLHHQLADRGARFVRACRTAPCYRLHALDTDPPKPGMVRVGSDDGQAGRRGDRGRGVGARRRRLRVVRGRGAAADDDRDRRARGRHDGRRGSSASPPRWTERRDITATGSWRVWSARQPLATDGDRRPRGRRVGGCHGRCSRPPAPRRQRRPS
jgi:hypothetical protein